MAHAHLTPTPVLEPGQDRTMILNMGPQHPSTHGVLRLLLEIDGETIVRIMPDIGFLHTGIEKTCEAKFYQQVVPLTDRIDYLCPHDQQSLLLLAVEKLLGLEIPPKAQWMRVLLNELTRINSHLVWLGTHAMDIGAMTVFLYCFREREDILRMFEMVSGQRMMTSYFRIGGLALEPPLGFFERVQRFCRSLPVQSGRVRKPADRKSDLGDAHQGRGADHARKMRLLWERRARRCAPAASISILRRDMPYSGYENFQFKVPVSQRRRRVRAVHVPGAGIAGVDRNRAAGAGRDAGRADQGRCAEGRAARPREDEDADGSPHLSLQDHHGRIHGSGGRGLPGDRVAARRDGLLRGQRWNGEAVSRAHAGAVLRESADAAEDVRRTAASQMWWRRLGPSTLCWARSTGDLCTLVIVESAMRTLTHMKFSENSRQRFAEMLTHYPTKRSVLVPTLLYAQDEVGS